MTLTEEDQVNGDKLRQLREERGWDWAQIARLSSLSVSQVRALESGSTDCFYTPQIKNNAARKVAQIMGIAETLVVNAPKAPQSDVTTEEAIDARITAIPGAMTPVSAAVSMPTQTPFLSKPRSVYAAAQASSWMSYGALTLLLVAGLGWYGLQPATPTMRPLGVMAQASANVPEVAAPTAAAKDTGAVVAVAVAVSKAPISETKPDLVKPKPAPIPAPIPAPVQASRAPGEVEMTPAALTPLAAPTDATCAFDAHVAVLQVKNPTKSSAQISLMPRQAGLLCVQDGSGKVRRENLKPGTWSTFNGQAPWKIYSAVLPGVDVFFQGEKIRPASANALTISLNGKELNP